jgi:methyl-accepting chemotaxis protein
MKGIVGSTNEVNGIVQDINQQMEEIGKIVRLITDISNQTNLLALNAAIEAARAGDAGRGFAVVAAEVKSLAQDSRESAENIADMITNLQAKTKKATDAIEHAGTAVEDGNQALGETIGAFSKIVESIEDITRNAVDMASSSEEQAAAVEEITASVNEVSILVQGTSKEAGSAATAAEEASVSIGQIGVVIGNVSEIAERISKEMSRFKI